MHTWDNTPALVQFLPSILQHPYPKFHWNNTQGYYMSSWHLPTFLNPERSNVTAFGTQFQSSKFITQRIRIHFWFRFWVGGSVTIHMDSFLSSHTCSTLTHISHAYDSLLPHLLHSDSYLSCLWLIAPTLTPLWLISPYCTFTIYTARYPPVSSAWSYSNIPEF